MIDEFSVWIQLTDILKPKLIFLDENVVDQFYQQFLVIILSNCGLAVSSHHFAVSFVSSDNFAFFIYLKMLLLASGRSLKHDWPNKAKH